MLLLKEKENDIKEIIDALYNCYLEELSDDGDELEDDVINLFKEKYHKPFDWANGATKVVLIFKDLGFVIKIPLMYCGGDEICGASEGINNWDYCSQEVCRYEMAEEEGFGNIFLETSLLGEVNNHPIYIQPYAEVLSKMNLDNYNSDHCSSTENDKFIVKEINNKENYEWLDSSWEADLLVQYGTEMFKKFKKYLKDNWIDDLRSANIGYVGKNPVLIDYAGFDN